MIDHLKKLPLARRYLISGSVGRSTDGRASNAAMAAPDTADDAMLARMLMMEEQAAADERGLDYSPTFRKRRLSDESEDYDPGSKRRAKPKPKPKPKPEPEPEPKPEPKPEPETVPSASEANPPEPRGKPKPPRRLAG